MSIFFMICERVVELVKCTYYTNEKRTFNWQILLRLTMYSHESLTFSFWHKFNVVTIAIPTIKCYLK